MGSPVSLERIEAVLGEVLTSDVTLVVEKLEPSPSPTPDSGALFLFQDNGPLLIGFELPGDLAVSAVSRVLGRPLRLASPEPALDATLSGALAAIVTEGARRALRAPFTIAGPPGGRPIGLGVEVTLFLDDRPFRVRLWVRSEPGPTGVTSRRTSAIDAISRLGATPVALHLVAAQSVATMTDVGLLVPGDVWLPGTGWMVEFVEGREPGQAPFDGRLALTAPASDSGISVQCDASGRLTISGEVVPLPLEPSIAPAPSPEETESLLVVRVEVAEVTLAASTWQTMATGADLQAGVRWLQRVRLRVAGQVVACGELASVAGEFGVRVLARRS